jgi:hypothetical protein
MAVNYAPIEIAVDYSEPSTILRVPYALTLKVICKAFSDYILATSDATPVSLDLRKI